MKSRLLEIIKYASSKSIVKLSHMMLLKVLFAYLYHIFRVDPSDRPVKLDINYSVIFYFRLSEFKS